MTASSHETELAHMNKQGVPISGDGYTKARGGKEEPATMIAEAQRQVRVPNEVVVYIRLGVSEKEGDRPLIDLAENAIELSPKAARDFAQRIIDEADRGEDELRRLTGQD